MIFVLCIILCVTPFVSTNQNLTVDDPRFPSLGKHFAGTPSLLASLALKEEIICRLLKNFQKDLREEPNFELESRCLPDSCDAVVDLVET